jgi:hypothetical protein
VEINDVASELGGASAFSIVGWMKQSVQNSNDMFVAVDFHTILTLFF